MESAALHTFSGYISSDTDEVRSDESTTVSLSLKTPPTCLNCSNLLEDFYWLIMLEKNKTDLLSVVDTVLNSTSYPIQELHHQPLGVLSAGGEDAQVSKRMNPLMNQHETLDAVFNCLEDMVSILLYRMRINLTCIGLVLTFDSLHYNH